MGRRKKPIVDKSPFKLRKRELADGRISLFIDHIADGKHKYEFLKLYLLPETSENVRRENTRTLRQAEDIIRLRTESLVQEKSDQITAKNLSETSLLELIDILSVDYRRKHGRENKRLLTFKSNIQAFRHDVRMCDIDKKFCIDYADWLRHAFISRNGTLLAPQTAFVYFWQLGWILGNALRMGYIRQNPWTQLESSDKIHEPERQHRFLTLEELEALENTPYKHDLIKRAFMFSCFSGLRISDVRNMKWSDLYSNDATWYVSIIMQKTSKPVSIPIPPRAMRWLPERDNGETNVFGKLPSQNQVNHHLRKWFEETGIAGRIHFHVSRHTYGTLLLTAGVDLYTASKLMGHNDIRATQVYAKIIDRKKQEAVSLIDNVF